jgi:hypothetical protein
MNTNTGQIYRGVTEIEGAIGRGEPVVPVSARVARLMERGNRHERRAEAAKLRRSKRRK